jgi:putative transposase
MRAACTERAMRKSKFGEEQIIGVQRKQEPGAATVEVCRKLGIGEATPAFGGWGGGRVFYRWKARFGGMAPSDAAKLKTLKDNSRRVKRLLAEAMLDVAAVVGMRAAMLSAT